MGVVNLGGETLGNFFLDGDVHCVDGVLAGDEVHDYGACDGVWEVCNEQGAAGVFLACVVECFCDLWGDIVFIFEDVGVYELGVFVRFECLGCNFCEGVIVFYGD